MDALFDLEYCTFNPSKTIQRFHLYTIGSRFNDSICSLWSLLTVVGVPDRFYTIRQLQVSLLVKPQKHLSAFIGGKKKNGKLKSRTFSRLPKFSTSKYEVPESRFASYCKLLMSH